MEGAIAVKVSGRFIDPSNPAYVGELCRVIRELVEGGCRLAVVVGGGGLARRYIEAARRVGVSEALLDSIGIEASRLNALLVASGLGDLAYPSVPRSFEDFLRAWASGRVVVMGGLQPGQSTSAVSALVAEAIGAKLLVNAASVDGVYDKDPRVHRDARRLEEVTVAELRRILSGQSKEAGGYELMDQVSLSVVERSGIRVVITYGGDPRNIARAVRGERVGTVVLP